jgi:hypothetical protein
MEPSGTLVLDRLRVEERVRAMLNRDDVVVPEWTVTPVAYPNFSSGARALHRIQGTANTAGEHAPWSMIIKVFERPTEGYEAGQADDPTTYAYWKREPLAFESGALAEITGAFRAPACFGVDWPTDHTAYVWLEELVERPAGEWSLERYGLAARHLGQFNGAYLAGHELPTAPWVASSRPVNEHWTIHPDIRESVETLRDPERWAACCHDRLSGIDVTSLRRFLDQHEAFLQSIQRLPQVFCHNDASRMNMFSVGGPGGPVTAAIDWELAGIGPLGGELAMLVSGSLFFFRLPIDEMAALEQIAIDEYMRGLADAGARADEAVVRFGHAACAVLRMAAIAAAWLQLAVDPTTDHATTFWARPTEELLANWEPILAFLDRKAAEALASPYRP